MLKLLQKEFILKSSRIQSERMGTVNHMKDLYDAARHLVWLTQFGLSVVLPPVLFLLGAVWLRKQFGLGGWVILVGFALGMVAAIGSLRSSLKTIERQGRAPEKKGRSRRLSRSINTNCYGRSLYPCKSIRTFCSRLGAWLWQPPVVPPLCWPSMQWLGGLPQRYCWVACWGTVIAVGNFLALSITVSNALDRAAAGG